MKYCAQPHCSTLVHHGKCVVHARVESRHDQQQRGTAHQRGYTLPWSTYSKARLKRLPVCGMREDGSLDAVHSRCVQRGLTTPAQCTDHIVPLAHGGAMWDVDNHLSLCLSCNTWKSNTLERQQARGF